MNHRYVPPRVRSLYSRGGERDGRHGSKRREATGHAACVDQEGTCIFPWALWEWKKCFLRKRVEEMLKKLRADKGILCELYIYMSRAPYPPIGRSRQFGIV